MGKSRHAVASDHQTHQECTGCQRLLPLEDFYERKDQRGRRRDCKYCMRSKSRQWNLNNPERYAYRQWKNKLRREFGITPEDYDSMFSNQDGKCLFCDNDRADSIRWRLCVDHCHTCNKVRGLLCGKCNTQLGWLENVGLDKIAAYLCCKSPLATDPVVDWTA